MRNNKKIIFIFIAVILLIALVVFSIYFVKDTTQIKNEIDAGKTDNSNNIETGKADDSNGENAKQVDEEFFEEYLKVFEYLGDDFKTYNDGHIRAFIVYNYIVDRDEGLIEFKELSQDSEYNQYIEVETQGIQKFVNDYFVFTDYKVENYEGEAFFKIEVNGEKTKIYTKSIGLDRYDMKIESISSDDNGYNTEVIAKFTLSAYELSDEYTLKFLITLEDGKYMIEDIKLQNLVPEQAELKDFVGKYEISLGVDGYENLEITYKNNKLYFDWTGGGFDGSKHTFRVKDYKFENNQLTVTKLYNEEDEVIDIPVFFIYRDKLFIKESIEKEDGTYEYYFLEAIKE